jgi:hypothetical protein
MRPVRRAGQRRNLSSAYRWAKRSGRLDHFGDCGRTGHASAAFAARRSARASIVAATGVCPVSCEKQVWDRRPLRRSQHHRPGSRSECSVALFYHQCPGEIGATRGREERVHLLPEHIDDLGRRPVDEIMGTAE